MQLFRSILFFFGLIILTPVFSIFVITLFPLKPTLRSKLASGWAYSVMFWLKVTCGLSFRVRGKDHLPLHPCVILAKHQSAWETIAFQTIFPSQTWVMKRSLLWIPFMGWAFLVLNAIPIDRSAGREALKQLVKYGQDRLAKGLWLVIFPEGTRIAPGERGKYHIGGAWLAAQTHTTVIPVAHNAGRFWRKNAFMKYPGIIDVVIGPPITTQGLKPDELNRQVEQWIESEMLKL